MRARRHPDLFDAPIAAPPGFRYTPEFIDPAEERALLAAFDKLPFKEFEFQGFVGKRRIVSFGWRYDFNGGGIQRIEPMPLFLYALRNRAAAFASPYRGARTRNDHRIP